MLNKENEWMNEYVENMDERVNSFTPLGFYCARLCNSHTYWQLFVKNSFTKLYQSVTDHLITVSRSQLDGYGCHLKFFFPPFLCEEHQRSYLCRDTVIFTVLSGVYNFHFLFSHISDTFNAFLQLFFPHTYCSFPMVVSQMVDRDVTVSAQTLVSAAVQL